VCVCVCVCELSLVVCVSQGVLAPARLRRWRSPVHPCLLCVSVCGSRRRRGGDLSARVRHQLPPSPGPARRVHGPVGTDSSLPHRGGPFPYPSLWDPRPRSASSTSSWEPERPVAQEGIRTFGFVRRRASLPSFPARHRAPLEGGGSSAPPRPREHFCVSEWDPWRLSPRRQPPGPHPPTSCCSSGVPLEGGGPVRAVLLLPAAARRGPQQQQQQPNSGGHPPTAAAPDVRGGTRGIGSPLGHRSPVEWRQAQNLRQSDVGVGGSRERRQKTGSSHSGAPRLGRSEPESCRLGAPDPEPRGSSGRGSSSTRRRWSRCGR